MEILREAKVSEVDKPVIKPVAKNAEVTVHAKVLVQEEKKVVGAQTHGRFAMGCGVKSAPRNTPKLAEKKGKKYARSFLSVLTRLIWCLLFVFFLQFGR